MKAATTLMLSLAALALGSAIDKRECAGDNCKRQVTGTRAGLLPVESRRADCSSFLRATVTPATRTITVTSWVAPGAVTAPAKLKRDGGAHNDNNNQPRQVTVFPSAVPTYASACDDGAGLEYAAACSCWGVTRSTVTRRAPRSTVTVTSTAGDCTALALTAVPSCAHACFGSAAPAFGCSGYEDIACQCRNMAALYEVVPACVATACPPASIGLIDAGASNACACHTATATATV